MNIKKLTFRSILSLVLLSAVPAMASCSGNATHQEKNDTEQKALRPNGKGGKGGKAGGPQLGTPGGGPVIDKTDDAVLQAMIKAEVPEFKQLVYSDSKTGKTLHYNLFTPKNIDDYLFRQDCIYLDTRYPYQFYQEGCIAGFMNLPFYEYIADFNKEAGALFTITKITFCI